MARVGGKGRAELQHPPPDPRIKDIDAHLARSSSPPRELRLECRYSQMALRMSAGGHRWRAREMGCSSLPYRASAQTVSRCRDNAGADALSMPFESSPEAPK
jgi:hypothetical protein